MRAAAMWLAALVLSAATGFAQEPVGSPAAATPSAAAPTASTPDVPTTEAAPASATAHVTYITGSSAYLDAGSDEGLGEGAKLEVIRDGAVVATLEVTYLSPHRASATILQGADAVRVGDAVRFTPAAAAVTPAVPLAAGGAAGSAPPPAATSTGGSGSAPPPSDSTRKGTRRTGPHGRVGVRYLTSKDSGDTAAEYSQPSLDLRLDGPNLGGSPVGLTVDARARRTYQTFADGTEENDGRTRIYALALTWDDAKTPVRFSLGRQSSPALAAVSIFDGLSFEYAAPRWSMGGFGGTQPDAVDFGYSSDVREYGIYHQVHGDPASARRWNLTTGVIGSYEESEVNREFLYFQWQYMSPHLSLYGTEEIDFNRGWKVDEAGESTLSSTGTFLSLNWRPGQVVSIRGGYDNRRNIRLYRDRVTPETEFDDAYRTGVWAGFLFRLADRFHLGIDGRRSSGGDAGDADAYTLTFSADRLAKVLAIRTRSTSYQNDVEEGWLHSLAFDVTLGSRVSLGLSGGLRSTTPLLYPDLADDLTWYALDLDVTLARQWYLYLSAEHSQGDLEDADQLYVAVTYRF